MNKILKGIMLVILALLTLYLGYAGVITYKYNHVYTTEQKINYIRNYYMHIGFPRTNEKLLKSKEFKDNHVEYSPAANPLDADAMAISFKTKHFDVVCSGGGNIMIDYGHYYNNNNIYDYYSGNKIKDKKETQLLNKELKELTDKFGKNMGLQIYNPF